MVAILDPKGRRPDPANETANTIRNPASDNSDDESLLPAQEAVSQARRQVTLATLHRYGSRPSKGLIIDYSGDAYLVDETRVDAQKVRIQDLLPQRFLHQLFDHFLDTEAPDGETKHDLDLESRLIESERARNTPGAIRNRRSTHASLRTKRNMHDPAAPPGKRRRSSTHERDVIKIDDDDYCDSETDLPDEWDGAESELQSIRYDQICELFYGPNFMFIGQLACKDIGRAWIKMCHPRKQSQYPYNGGATVARSLREHGYKGAYTKPSWWPADEGWRQGFGCRHIEPDHLKKLERVFLLKHLLRYGGQFPLEKLRESTAKIDQEYSKNWNPDKIARLALIYRVRQKEMQYEDGLIDSDATLTTPIPYPGKGKARAALKAETPVRVKKERRRRQPMERAPLPVPTVDMGIGAAAEEENDPALTATDEVDSSTLEDTATSVAEDAMDESTVMPISSEVRPSQHGLHLPSPTFPAEQQHVQTQGQPRHRDTTKQSPQMQRPLTQAMVVKQHCSLPVDPQTQPPSRRESIAQTQVPSFTPVNAPHQDPTARPLLNGSAFQQPQQPILTSQGYTIDPNRTHEMEVVHRPRRIRNPNIIPATEISSQTPPPRPVAPRALTFAASSSGLSGLDTSTMTYWNNIRNNIPHYNINSAVYNEGADPNILLTSTANLSGASCSFSSDFTESSADSYGSGVQLNAWDQYPQQAQDEDLIRQYFVFANQMYQPGPFGDATTEFEAKYHPYGPGQQRRQ